MNMKINCYVYGMEGSLRQKMHESTALLSCHCMFTSKSHVTVQAAVLVVTK